MVISFCLKAPIKFGAVRSPLIVSPDLLTFPFCKAVSADFKSFSCSCGSLSKFRLLWKAPSTLTLVPVTLDCSNASSAISFASPAVVLACAILSAKPSAVVFASFAVVTALLDACSASSAISLASPAVVFACAILSAKPSAVVFASFAVVTALLDACSASAAICLASPAVVFACAMLSAKPSAVVFASVANLTALSDFLTALSADIVACSELSVADCTNAKASFVDLTIRSTSFCTRA